LQVLHDRLNFEKRIASVPIHEKNEKTGISLAGIAGIRDSFGKAHA